MKKCLLLTAKYFHPQFVFDDRKIEGTSGDKFFQSALFPAHARILFLNLEVATIQ